MDNELQQRISAGLEAVQSQTDLFIRHFGRVESEWKADRSRITMVDRMIGDQITRALEKRFPEDDVFSEEMVSDEGPMPRTAPFSWVLDPIDGTNNYALGLPHCAISLGLLRDGVPVYGVIFDHSRRSTFHGGPESGLYENKRPVVSRPDPVRHRGFIGMHSPFDPGQAEPLRRVMAEWKIRALGSSTLHLTYVATGLLHGAVDFNVRIWDIAAACALCAAAGAEVHYLDGPLYPLNQFDLDMPRVRYYAGLPAVIENLQELLT